MKSGAGDAGRATDAQANNRHLCVGNFAVFGWRACKSTNSKKRQAKSHGRNNNYISQYSGLCQVW
jgi:hypothetical protein